MRLLFFVRTRGLVRSLAAALPALCLLPAARAQTVVYSNGLPDNMNAFFSDASLQPSEFTADTFTFSSSTTFNSVQWNGIYSPVDTPTVPDNFTIAFYNTTGGTLDVTAFVSFNVGSAVNRTPTGGPTPTTLGSTNYSYSSALAGGVTLGPGTYGISIFNDLTGDVDDGWAWQTSNQTGTNYFRTATTDPFTPSASGDVSFRLVNTTSGAIPEPGSLALLGAGAFPLAGHVLRRRKNRV